MPTDPGMKTTEWREYREPGDSANVHRIRATYGLRTLGNQEPYFSITAETERRPRRGGQWREESGGTLHDLIKRHFSELRDLVPWHLTSLQGGPMHYEANAVYHLLDEHNLGYFKSTVVWGTTPYDKLPLPTERASLIAWLRRRKPALMRAFHKTLDRHPEIEILANRR